jgi:hypothetical protein
MAVIWYVVLATVLGLVLRCLGAATTPLDFDEGASLYFARLPWSELLGGPARLEPNPPLFYALAHVTVGTLGATAWALRLPSIVAGTLCAPVAAYVAWKAANPRTAGAANPRTEGAANPRTAGAANHRTAGAANHRNSVAANQRTAGAASGVSAAFLVATSTVGVVSSQDARAYAMLTLALLLAAAALMTAFDAQTETAVQPRQAGVAWAVFVAAGLAGLYLHHTAVLLILALDGAAMMAWMVSARRPWRFPIHLVVANVGIAVLYLPWLPVTLGQVGGMPTNSWMQVPTVAALRYGVLNMYAQPYATGLEPWADRVFLAAGLAGVVAARKHRFVLAMAFLLLGGVPAASWLISQVRPIMNGKTLLPLAPVFLVFVALGCGWLGRLRVPAAAALVLVQIWSCWAYLGDRPEESYPAVVAALRERVQPGDRFVLAPRELEILLDYYGWPRDRLHVSTVPAPATWFRASTARAELPQGAGRVWLLSRSVGGRRDALRALGDVGAPIYDEAFGRGRMRDLELSLFAHGP